MKKQLCMMIGFVLLLSVDLFAATGGLTEVTSAVDGLKDTFETLAKSIAVIGLIVIVIRYFMQPSETRSIPWAWIIGAIILGAIPDILDMFNIN